MKQEKEEDIRTTKQKREWKKAVARDLPAMTPVERQQQIGPEHKRIEQSSSQCGGMKRNAQYCSVDYKWVMSYYLF